MDDPYRDVVAKLTAVLGLLRAAHDNLATHVPATIGEAYMVSVVADALRAACGHCSFGCEQLATLLQQLAATAPPAPTDERN